MRAAVVYWSKTGNTEQVAQTIERTLQAKDVDVTCCRVEEAADLDWFAYDLLCLGFPSYSWSPPKPMDNWLKNKFATYRGGGRVRTGSPKIPGKYVLIFCTYSGPHTGIDEAIPAVKYAGQFFAHLGLQVVDEWYVIGEFHGSLERSTEGRLGDIRGRPNEQDLAQIEQDTRALLDRIQLISR
jgi:flavodoxin I